MTKPAIESPQGRTAARDALTRLMRKHVGVGRALTLREFAERAVDPVTGTTISKSTVGNLVTGSSIKITPEILGAIAAGLGVPLRLVQAAAAEQYVGLVLDHEAKPHKGTMEQSDIESVLWDCVTAPDDDSSHLGYQTTGVGKLAELIAEQSRRINELESKVAALAAGRPDEK